MTLFNNIRLKVAAIFVLVAVVVSDIPKPQRKSLIPLDCCDLSKEKQLDCGLRFDPKFVVKTCRQWLFRPYHKQKKFLQNGIQIKDLDAQLMKGEHLKAAEKERDSKDLKHESNIEKMQDVVFKEISEEPECRTTELNELKRRMIGWFDIVHTVNRQEHHRAVEDISTVKIDHLDRPEKHQKRTWKIDRKERPKRATNDIVEKESHGGCECSKAVMWEFRNQDTSGDGHLTENELIVMESNRREPCMKHLLKSCDADRNIQLTGGEWCCCFEETITPCVEKKKQSYQEDWVPSCDKEGYFEREQCHKNGACWCVDLNGNEIRGTKTERGKAECGKFGPNRYPIRS